LKIIIEDWSNTICFVIDPDGKGKKRINIDLEDFDDRRENLVKLFEELGLEVEYFLAY
jgi:hypothetical protein